MPTRCCGGVVVARRRPRSKARGARTPHRTDTARDLSPRARTVRLLDLRFFKEKAVCAAAIVNHGHDGLHPRVTSGVVVSTAGRESGGSWFEACSGVRCPRRRPCGVAVNVTPWWIYHYYWNKLAGRQGEPQVFLQKTASQAATPQLRALPCQCKAAARASVTVTAHAGPPKTWPRPGNTRALRLPGSGPY